MTLTILLAIASGIAWGLNMVVTRWGFDRTGVTSDVGALVAIAASAIVAAGIALAAGDTEGFDAEAVVRFSLVGLIAPGAAQILFFAAISTIGPARSGVYVGSSPMFGVVLAILLIGEDLRAAVVVGTILTVAGGVTVSWQRTEGSLLTAGAFFAIGTALCFGLRDVAAREFTADTDMPPAWGATVILTAGGIVLLVIAVLRQRGGFLREVRRASPELVVSGVIIGVALPTLLWALSRGEVGIVSPITNGSQVMTVVVVSLAVYGRTDPPARLLTAAALVIGGGTLIGATA